MSVEAAITIYSNIIWRRVLFTSDKHSGSNYKVYSSSRSSPATFLHVFREKLMTDRTLWTESQRNMVAPISRYRARVFIKVFKRPNTLTYTFLRIGISDSWWHGKQVCEYFEIKKEKRKLSRSVIQCYCGCGVSRDKYDASPWKRDEKCGNVIK